MDFYLTEFARERTLKGQRVGYVRVSSFDQNPERQLEQVQVDKVFIDKGMKIANPPGCSSLGLEALKGCLPSRCGPTSTDPPTAAMADFETIKPPKNPLQLSFQEC